MKILSEITLDKVVPMIFQKSSGLRIRTVDLQVAKVCAVEELVMVMKLMLMPHARCILHHEITAPVTMLLMSLLNVAVVFSACLQSFENLSSVDFDEDSTFTEQKAELRQGLFDPTTQPFTADRHWTIANCFHISLSILRTQKVVCQDTRTQLLSAKYSCRHHRWSLCLLLARHWTWLTGGLSTSMCCSVKDCSSMTL